MRTTPLCRPARHIALLAFLVLVPVTSADDDFSLEDKPARKPTRASAAKPEKTVAEPPRRLEKYLGVQHPRLLVTPERLALIRQQIKVPGSHHQLAYAAMVERCRQDPRTVWGGDARKGYWPVYASRELAFLSLLSEDPKEKRRYAEMAAKVLPDLNYVQWFGFKSKSLGHAMATFGTALTYDWAHNEWTDAERQKAEVLLEYLTEHWNTYKRVSEEKVTGYNFYGVLYGAQIMLHLAGGQEKTSHRFPVCVDVLTRHLADVGGELGAHNEGIGYTEYPMGFALPAALALAQHGESRPLDAARKHAFWTLNLYVQTFMTSFDRKIVQYGVSHRSNSNEGFATLVLGLCPPDQLPYYVWFYDRHMGRLAKAEESLRYDRGRGNTPFALLCYPSDVVAKDPTGVMPRMVADSDGYIFFRNRWQDENDIQVGLLNPVRRSGGWSQDEYLNLRLMAFDTRFFGGPGKERGVENYSTLLVDNANVGKASTNGFTPGRTVAVEPSPNGGYAVVDASDYYKSLGVDRASRHLLVAFSDPKDNFAILSTLDDIQSATDHQYTWQANLGPEGTVKSATESEEETVAAGKKSDRASAVPSLDAPDPQPAVPEDATPAKIAPPKPEDDGIKSECGNESGRPFFLLTGRQGYVKGWVLHPADATIKVGDPLRIDTRSKNARIWVVMFTGTGNPPSAEIAGSGMQTSLTATGRKVFFGADRDRVQCVP